MKIKLKDGVVKPNRAHEFDAGYDLYSPKRFFVNPNSISERIDLGVAFEIPEGYVGFIVERSSQGAKGIDAKKGMVVDSGYTGWVHITISNDSNKIYEVETNDRIGQIIFLKCLNDELEVVNEFKETKRGDGSHGSSGI